MTRTRFVVRTLNGKSYLIEGLTLSSTPKEFTPYQWLTLEQNFMVQGLISQQLLEVSRREYQVADPSQLDPGYPVAVA